jgi:hypothetical protein
MHHWTKRILVAAGALLLTGCLWGPGRFASDLTLRKDGSFVLNYKGEIVLQLPPDASAKPEPWNAKMARCYKDGRAELLSGTQGSFQVTETPPPGDEEQVRPCTPAELAKLKSQFEADQVDQVAKKRKEGEEVAKMFGIPGLDDESNRLFAAKLMKFDGWRSVVYRGNGVFDVDYHLDGRATQDFMFPMLPDNDLLIPFVAIRRRTDGSVFVTAPAMTGGSGPIAARAGQVAASSMKEGPVSRAQGRFTVITDGEILTNNSDDGPAPNALGRQVHWDVGPSSTKIPETLIRLR